jgi:hypothetical protein
MSYAKHFNKNKWSLNRMDNVGFEVLTMVVMKSSIFWDIMLCSLLNVIWHRLQFQGQRIGHERNQRESR